MDFFAALLKLLHLAVLAPYLMIVKLNFCLFVLNHISDKKFSVTDFADGASGFIVALRKNTGFCPAPETESQRAKVAILGVRNALILDLTAVAFSLPLVVSLIISLGELEYFVLRVICEF